MLGLLLMIATLFMAAGRASTGKHKGGGTAKGTRMKPGVKYVHFHVAQKKLGSKLKAFIPFTALLPAQAAAGATTTTLLGIVPSSYAQAGWQTLRCSVVAPSLVTGVTTNTATINFRLMRAGAFVANLASLPLITGTNLPVETEVVAPLAAAQALVPGDVIDVQLVQGGTGLVIPVGIEAKVELQ